MILCTWNTVRNRYKQLSISSWSYESVNFTWNIVFYFQLTHLQWIYAGKHCLNSSGDTIRLVLVLAATHRLTFEKWQFGLVFSFVMTMPYDELLFW